MKNRRLHFIEPGSPPDSFPPIDIAMREPDGLLAVGGDLGSARLLAAYSRGIFPWYMPGQPILWWSPDPRCVFRPQALHVSRSLRKAMRCSDYRVSFNQRFVDVISACAEPRPHQDGTWITDDMRLAYTRLHFEGWAHSVEMLDGDELVGGLYGLAIGRVFFGESMFSRRSNASKMAMAALAAELTARDFCLLDGQVESPHLVSLGAQRMPRREFREELERGCKPALPLTDLPRETRPVSDYA